MKAHKGDRITIESKRVGSTTRTGEVVEVIRGADNAEHYRVRWDDGHETTYFPSSDAHLTARG